MKLFRISLLLSLLIVFFSCTINPTFGPKNPTYPNDPGGVSNIDLPDPPSGIPTARSASIGHIPADLHISADGSAHYSVPIRVPRGRQSIEPRLSLDYNSRGGDSILGLRWSLNGLSAINRVGSEWVHDGELRRMEFDTEDHFELDGERLVAVEGDYYDSGTEYRTKRDQFSRSSL